MKGSGSDRQWERKAAGAEGSGAEGSGSDGSGSDDRQAAGAICCGSDMQREQYRQQEQ